MNYSHLILNRRIAMAAGALAVAGLSGAYIDRKLFAAARAGGQLRGKSMVCLGDSITEFGDYPERIGARLGARVLSGGFGGCRMAGARDGAEPSYDAMSMSNLSGYIARGDFAPLLRAADDLYKEHDDDNRRQAAAVAAVDWSSLDYLTIFFGRNDFTGGVPIGLPDDDDDKTFKGGINRVIRNIVGSHPQIRLLFIGLLYTQMPINPLGLSALDYIAALKERCGAYNIPVLDMYRTAGINDLNFSHWMQSDSHPLAPAGYALIADKIAGAIGAM